MFDVQGICETGKIIHWGINAGNSPQHEELIIARFSAEAGPPLGVPKPSFGISAKGQKWADIAALAGCRQHLPRPSLATDASLRKTWFPPDDHPVDVGLYV